ncbi:3-oxo-5-alpha-steroid 4-dehydrogenase 1 [Gossypium australe]|uniref:3-oxo-5-alpha-steroid 4-dehydrogenase 1 n=1 Tax=Gossypium australe TaxID=47621 RepID=A0A5B6W467_9ROSI|nr:3-oxo-5-alpha-steroid 4-dehydrogenase 1 [Gossypium australe]
MVIRILRWGEDKRYDRMRHNVGNLAVFFIFQGLWVWTVTLPVTVVNASDKDPSIQAEDIIGWIMWFVGTIVEILADKDKFSFKNSPESKGKWCEIGLWKYSRHPNYFGDVSIIIFQCTKSDVHTHIPIYIVYERQTWILLTWGYFVASLPIIEGAEWLVLIGPVFLTLLLLFVSGLTILEKSGDKKFGNMEAYRVYKKRTRLVIASSIV